MAESKKILILSNHFITLYSFRREMIARLCERGHSVYLSMPADEKNVYFEKLGCHVIETAMSRRGMNPAEDLKLLGEYGRIMREIKPDVIFSYTIKPNIYGTMASNRLGIRQICNITGGTMFMKENLVSKVIRMLYRMSIKKAYRVYFQNTGDRDYYRAHGLVGDNWEMLPGSGVNLEQHALCPMPQEGPLSFIFIGRLMEAKGIDQYLECARRIRARHEDTRFYVAGFIEEKKYETLIEGYVSDGSVEYLGFRDDIDEWIRRCSCTVLPSLGGEGVPNAVLESAATGRPCIASNIPGSRDAVEDGVTGYLFTPGSTEELTDKVERFLALSAQERENMGLAGRAKMEREFDREIVIGKYIMEAER